jgi:hypothetical protein
LQSAWESQRDHAPWAGQWVETRFLSSFHATASWVRAAPSLDFQVAYRTKNYYWEPKGTGSNGASGIQIRDQLVFEALDSVTQAQLLFFHALNQQSITPGVRLEINQFLVDGPMTLDHQ